MGLPHFIIHAFYPIDELATFPVEYNVLIVSITCIHD